MGILKHMKMANLLFSFYDLAVSIIPFRKKSYDIIKVKGEKYENR